MDKHEAQGLEVVAYSQGEPFIKLFGPSKHGIPLVRLSDATAVIDQLRERVAELEESCRLLKNSNKFYASDVDRLTDANELLESECAKLAAGACDGVVGDDYGHAYCKYKKELAALKSAPVVMPERRHIDSFFRSYKHDLGWNACLDKFESLNRSKT